MYIAIYRHLVLPRDRFGGTFRFMARGDFSGLLLSILREEPMHGYEVMKAVEERFHGFYKPSPGAVYPALRSLQRRGLVTVEGGERRKTYRVTAKGIAQVRSAEKEIRARFQTMEKTLGPERMAMLREFRITGRLLAANMKDVTPEQAKELQVLMSGVREKILRILAT